MLTKNTDWIDLANLFNNSNIDNSKNSYTLSQNTQTDVAVRKSIAMY